MVSSTFVCAVYRSSFLQYGVGVLLYVIMNEPLLCCVLRTVLRYSTIPILYTGIQVRTFDTGRVGSKT